MMTSSSAPKKITPPADACGGITEQIKFWAFCTTIVGTAFSNSVASVGTVVYGIALAAGVFKKGRPLPAFPAAPLAAALTLATLVSAALAFGAYPGEARQGLLKFAWSMLILYAGVDAVRTREQLRAAIAVLLSCEAAAAVSGIAQDILGWDWIRNRALLHYTDNVFRITGPFKHCNDFATFLIPGWVIGCAVFLDRIRVRKALQAIAAAAVLGLIGWAMFRTMSRSAMISAFFGTAVLALAMPYRRTILITIACLAGAAWWVPSPFGDRLHSMVNLSGGDLGERVYLIKASLKMIHAAPWFGLGLNTYSVWFPVYNPPDPTYPVVMYAHNSFLQMATETGWVGLGLFLAFVAALLVRSARGLFTGPKDDWSLVRAGVWASLTAILLNGFFESLLQSTLLRTLFWSLMGLSLAFALSRNGKPGASASR